MAKRPFPSTFATALRGAPRTLSSKIAYPHEALATADRVAHNMQCQSDIERVTAGQNTAGRANALTGQQICLSIPLKRWSGASRAQSMHIGT